MTKRTATTLTATILVCGIVTITAARSFRQRAALIEEQERDWRHPMLPRPTWWESTQNVYRNAVGLPLLPTPTRVHGGLDP